MGWGGFGGGEEGVEVSELRVAVREGSGGLLGGAEAGGVRGGCGWGGGGNRLDGLRAAESGWVRQADINLGLGPGVGMVGFGANHGIGGMVCHVARRRVRACRDIRRARGWSFGGLQILRKPGIERFGLPLYGARRGERTRIFAGSKGVGLINGSGRRAYGEGLGRSRGRARSRCEGRGGQAPEWRIRYGLSRLLREARQVFPLAGNGAHTWFYCIQGFLLRDEILVVFPHGTWENLSSTRRIHESRSTYTVTAYRECQSSALILGTAPTWGPHTRHHRLSYAGGQNGNHVLLDS